MGFTRLKSKDNAFKIFKHRYELPMSVVYTLPTGSEKLVYFDVKVYSKDTQTVNFRKSAKIILLQNPCYGQYGI